MKKELVHFINREKYDKMRVSTLNNRGLIIILILKYINEKY